LLQSGCRRIACLDTEVQRTDGYRKAHEDAGVPIDARLVLRADNFFRSSGTKAAARLLDEGLEVDGIVCQSDAQANGVINELHLRGVKVPEQVKVTGVDNSPIAENCIVPVTSMTSEVRAAGVKTMELLLKKIQGQDVKPEIIKPRLIQRRSTGAKPRPESEPHELD
jgi:DNA-binding LacI/PurR family transcriptional regulator